MQDKPSTTRKPALDLTRGQGIARQALPANNAAALNDRFAKADEVMTKPRPAVAPGSGGGMVAPEATGLVAQTSSAPTSQSPAASVEAKPRVEAAKAPMRKASVTLSAQSDAVLKRMTLRLINAGTLSRQVDDSKLVRLALAVLGEKAETLSDQQLLALMAEVDGTDRK